MIAHVVPRYATWRLGRRTSVQVGLVETRRRSIIELKRYLETLAKWCFVEIWNEVSSKHFLVCKGIDILLQQLN